MTLKKCTNFVRVGFFDVVLPAFEFRTRLRTKFLGSNLRHAANKKTVMNHTSGIIEFRDHVFADQANTPQ